MTPPAPTRRDVLAGAAGVAALAAGAPLGAEPEPASPRPLPTSPFGKTKDRVTRLGLGCFYLGSVPDDDLGVRIARRALEAGITYFDTAPSYSAGGSETRVGRALQGWPREKVFLATKTHTRTAEEARRDLEGSLQRLRVDRIDLVQVHAVKDAADLDRALSATGPLAALRKAKEEGLVRYIGVTGHEFPAIVRRAIDEGPFDSVLFPVNCVDPHHRSFVADTLPAAVRNGLARIAMKVFASGNLVQRGIDAEACLRYVLGLDVTTAIVGCSTTEQVDLAVRVAREAKPLSAAETEQLLRSTKPHVGRDVEWYKKD